MKTETIREADIIGERWKIVQKLGEGGCGQVFQIKDLENTQNYAMKTESTKQKSYDQLLKTEAAVLQKLQFSRHFPAFIYFGQTSDFRLLVMELLGRSLNDLQKMKPERRLSVGTVLRIGLQALQAVYDLHRTFFVHRDIKPSNFALGSYPNHRRVYLFDFGLARSLLDPESTATKRLRRGRRRIGFRGTVAFCSPNVHDGIEHGRHDDLWSLLYMCVEMIAGSLPWSELGRKKAAYLKKNISDRHLLAGCPKKFQILLNYFRALRYEHRPDYRAVRRVFESCIAARHVRDEDPFDWECEDEQYVRIESIAEHRPSAKSSTLVGRGRRSASKTLNVELFRSPYPDEIDFASVSPPSTTTISSAPPSPRHRHEHNMSLAVELDAPTTADGVSPSAYTLPWDSLFTQLTANETTACRVTRSASGLPYPTTIVTLRGDAIEHTCLSWLSDSTVPTAAFRSPSERTVVLDAAAFRGAIN